MDISVISILIAGTVGTINVFSFLKQHLKDKNNSSQTRIEACRKDFHIDDLILDVEKLKQEINRLKSTTTNSKTEINHLSKQFERIEKSLDKIIDRLIGDN